MYELTLRTEFAAAHRIRLADGQMEPMHGHNWRVEVDLRGPTLDDTGIVADFTVLQAHLRAAISELHNTVLNDVPGLADPGPTTELIAKHLHDRLAGLMPATVQLRRVRVWETAECAAAYIPEGLHGAADGF